MTLIIYILLTTNFVYLSYLTVKLLIIKQITSKQLNLMNSLLDAIFSLNILTIPFLFK